MIPAGTYSQSLGTITTPDGVTVASGWAGNGLGKNQPAAQGRKCLGPLPQGVYVVGEWLTHPRLGRMAAELTQVSGDTFGRYAFFIHGPSKDASRYGQESLGCIVMPYSERLKAKEALPEGSYLRVVA